MEQNHVTQVYTRCANEVAANGLAAVWPSDTTLEAAAEKFDAAHKDLASATIVLEATIIVRSVLLLKRFSAHMKKSYHPDPAQLLSLSQLSALTKMKIISTREALDYVVIHTTNF